MRLKNTATGCPYTKTVSVILICIVNVFTHLSAAVGDRYTLVHALNELQSGDEIVIVNGTWSQTLGSYSAKNKKYDGCGISINGETATVTDAGTEVLVYETKDGSSYLKTKSTGEYIGCYVKGSSTVDKGISKAASFSSSKSKYFKCNFIFNSNNQVDIQISPTKSSTWHFSINNTSSGYVWYFDNITYTADYRYSIYKKADTENVEQVQLTLDGRASDAKNAEMLSAYNGKTVGSITVSRAFAADGGWYTLCLPFALTAADIAKQFKGALFNEFTGVEMTDNGTARLQFKKVSETKAGYPYMVLPKETVDNPVFTDKTLTSTPQTVIHSCQPAGSATVLNYQFAGAFDPTLVSGNDIRFVGGDKGTELLIPDGEGTMKGLRAYFRFPEHSEGVITLSKLNVDNGEATGITGVVPSSGKASRVQAAYTLSGIRMPSAQQLKPGLYIKNGKKVAIK